MLIVLVISSLLVGIAFSVLNLIQSQVLMIKEYYHLKTREKQTQEILSVDLNRHSTIFYIRKDSVLSFTSPIDTINYKLNNSLLVRKDDTLYSGLRKIEFYNNGVLTKDKNIDALKVFFTDERYIFLYKRMDYKNRMDWE
mgnify:CR=1 FL=1